MKEFSKQNKFMQKTDIYEKVKKKISKQELDSVLNQLCEDGLIFNTYDNEIFSVNEII
jgi:transcriptional regulator CtsR